MATISSLGIGSGIDVPTIVDELIAAQREPADLRFDQQEAELQASLSGVGLLKSSLSEFQSALSSLELSSTFNTRSATSADEDLFTATANTDAAPGSFEVEVVNLAQAHRVITTGISDTTSVGTGTLTIDVGGAGFEVVIDDSNNSLAGIRDAINAAGGGVSASILTVDDGNGGTEDKLVLNAEETGADNAITITVDDDDTADTDANGLSRLASDQLTELTAAQDATVKIDQQTISRDTNTISDVIEGVTLTLLAKTETPDETTTLTIGRDTSTASEAVDNFVTKFNELAILMGELNAFDGDTGQAGILLGDSTLRSVENQIRGVLSDAVPGLSGGVRALADLGITTQRDGTLTVDQSKLSSAVEDNLGDVEKLFSSDSGLATRLDATLDAFLQFDGILSNRVDGINSRLEDIDEQRVTLDNRMASLEERLIAQFTAMDQIVAQLRADSDFLLQQVDNLPGTIQSNKN